MDERVKLRIKFKKYGAMRFIGHLDVMRFFQKLMRRAHVDIAYSEGFHPHQLMSFANPLGVGISSEAEYLDIVMACPPEDVDCDDIVRRLDRACVEGFEVTGAVVLPEGAANGMASVAMADYSVSLPEYDEADLAECCKRLMDSPEVMIEKKTKKGVRQVDIKPGIHELKSDNGTVFMKLSAGSVLNIRPEQVLEAMSVRIASLEHPVCRVHRLEQYETSGRSLLLT